MAQAEEHEPERQVVVVGSSAGGIDALGVLVGSLPESFSAPIVIAQHLDPRRESHLQQILARSTSHPVRLVLDEATLEPGVVYLAPADRDLVVSDGHVNVAEPDGRTRSIPSIDRLFSTASEAYGENVIGVILTGGGSDGAAGARLIKAAGGTVVIQDPATAAHSSMPLALPPSIVDIVAKLDAIGPLLDELVRGEFAALTPDDERTLDHFLGQLREQTGIDFSTYKRPTIRRRLDRRMSVVGAESLQAYVRYLSRHPEEYARLSSTFLIKVTEFFRDPDLFDYLRTTVIPDIVHEAAGNDREIRVWSAGVATGEEAYSLAMLFAEALGDEIGGYNLRIFATDLDNEAINFARGGVYPRGAVTSVPADLREKYLIPVGDSFEVRKQIRALTVFGQHDLGLRAPFPRIDLVLSRNVLIYFTHELQKRALQLFAFSLRPGGYLVLGKAESTTPYPDHFVLEHPRLKVYRRQGERVLIPPTRVPRLVGERLTVAPQQSSALRRLARNSAAEQRLAPRGAGVERPEAVLLRLPIGVVIVDPKYDIQFINNVARRLLGIHGPAIGDDLVRAAKVLPSADLREAIDRVLGGTETSFAADVPGDNALAGVRHLLVQTLDFPVESDAPRLAVVLVEDRTAIETERGELQSHVEGLELEVEHLQHQLEALDRTNHELIAANQDLGTANAELRSANEELLVGSEEVQAATEEVETLNEELQATNEELETLNEELQATVEELNTTNDDLEARTVELEEVAQTLEQQRRTTEAQRGRLEAALNAVPWPLALFTGGGEAVVTNAAWMAVGEVLSDAVGNPRDWTDGERRQAAGGREWLVQRRLLPAAEDEPGHLLLLALPAELAGRDGD